MISLLYKEIKTFNLRPVLFILFFNYIIFGGFLMSFYEKKDLEDYSVHEVAKMEALENRAKNERGTEEIPNHKKNKPRSVKRQKKFSRAGGIL